MYSSEEDAYVPVWDESSALESDMLSYDGELGNSGMRMSIAQQKSISQTHSSPDFSNISIGNGVHFVFTEQSAVPGWNKNNNSFVQVVEDDDNFEDKFVGRNFDDFEKKLSQGFLEAPNLGLVCAPPAIFDYKPALQRIDLKDNKLELLPEQFFEELPMLCWCDVRYNRLQELPPMSNKHENLNVLLLQDNLLTSLPISLAYACKLHTLGWTNNNITDPPRHVLLRGCPAILSYLRVRLAQTLPIDEEGNLIMLHGDEQLKEDLKKTAAKSKARKSVSQISIVSGGSNKSGNSRQEELNQKRRIDRVKYTWDLWKNIPYNGITNQTLFEKSLQEVKDEVRSKLNQNKEVILQKMKDNDALGKWRWEARMQQMKGPSQPYNGVTMPFGTDADVPVKQDAPCEMDAENFRSNMSECLSKLREFAVNPAPINDTEKSMQRLKEVEDIQRKLLDMKLTWSVKSSNPT